MKRLKKHQDKEIFATIFLIASFIFLIYLLLPAIRETNIFLTIKDYYQEHLWRTFSSDRVSLTFKYPDNWPVIVASDSELKESNRLTSEEEFELENIDFQEEWNRAAGGPRLGWISVRKLKDISNLNDYIKEINKETTVEAKGTKFTVPPPKITFTTIGGERAILVKDRSTFGSFSKSLFDYRVVRDGLLYEFVASSSERFLEDKENNSDTFQKIISTVEFPEDR